MPKKAQKKIRVSFVKHETVFLFVLVGRGGGWGLGLLATLAGLCCYATLAGLRCYATLAGLRCYATLAGLWFA